MTSQTPNKGLVKPGHNEDVDTWDVPVNANSDSIDACLGNVTVINMTSLSSYALSASDVLATTIKFTGTLGSGIIPVLMPNGAGGQFTIIDATTHTDNTSQLGFGWTVSGTGVLLAPGATQPLIADGTNAIWAVAGAQSVAGVTYMDLTGLSGSVTLTDDRCRNKTWVFYGTLVNANLTLVWPVASAGVYALVHRWSAAGGSSNLVMGVAGASSTSTISISANTKFMAAYYRTDPTSNNWFFQRLSADV